MRLRAWAQEIDTNSIVAQRLKRFSSIYAKLLRFKTMKLWDMQDIGGCRAIVHTVHDIDQLIEECKSSSIRHKPVHEDDYIRKPRDSGYRSRHLVLRYYSDRNEIFNGLKIEMQLRTPLQHAWATAVETVDAFTGQALKSSSGTKDWERLFQLMGTEMAFREGTAPVLGTPTNLAKLTDELRTYANRLNVKARLEGFTAALKATPAIGGNYFLLSLDTNKDILTITSYDRKELDRASKDYAKREKRIRQIAGTDAVLVAVDSITNLQRA